MPYQGTLLTIRTAVIDKLRLDTTEDSARVNEWINLAYAEVVQETAALQTTGTATLTSDEDAYQIPVEVAWIRALVLVYSDGSISMPLVLVSLDELIEYRRASGEPNQQVASPVYAVVGQNRMEIWPDPGAGETIKFWYAYLPPELTVDADEPALMEPYGSRLLELGACVQGAKFKKDPLLANFEADYAVWMGKFQRWLNRRQTGGPRATRVILTSEQPPLALARDVG